MAEARFLKCSCTHCGGHIEFPDEAAGIAVNCPHCGKETILAGGGTAAQTTKKGKALMMVAVTVVIAAAAAGAWFFLKGRKSDARASNAAETPAKVSATAAAEPKEASEKMETTAAGGENLQLLRFDLPKARAKGSSLVYLQGTVTNQAKVQYFSVKVEFDLLNGKGEKVGIAKDQLANLAPHTVWNFKALVVDKNVVSARLASLKGEKE